MSRMFLWAIALLTCLTIVGAWRTHRAYWTRSAHSISSIGIPACSHAGLEDEGHFEFMCSFYTISCWPFTRGTAFHSHHICPVGQILVSGCPYLVLAQYIVMWRWEKHIAKKECWNWTLQLDCGLHGLCVMIWILGQYFATEKGKWVWSNSSGAAELR